MLGIVLISVIILGGGVEVGLFMFRGSFLHQGLYV
jgi:hypothetical protein